MRYLYVLIGVAGVQGSDWHYGKVLLWIRWPSIQELQEASDPLRHTILQRADPSGHQISQDKP